MLIQHLASSHGKLLFFRAYHDLLPVLRLRKYYLQHHSQPHAARQGHFWRQFANLKGRRMIASPRAWLHTVTSKNDDTVIDGKSPASAFSLCNLNLMVASRYVTMQHGGILSDGRKMKQRPPSNATADLWIQTTQNRSNVSSFLIDKASNNDFKYSLYAVKNVLSSHKVFYQRLEPRGRWRGLLSDTWLAVPHRS